MPPLPTRTQVSAGGVACRGDAGRREVALICVGEKRRWQLPKGIVEEGEAPEVAALREVREEAGVEAELVAPLETIEYWYVASERGDRVRFHKFVHFFLMRYVAGDVADHDHEVLEARWVPLGEARAMLSFASEKKVLDEAATLLGEPPPAPPRKRAATRKRAPAPEAPPAPAQLGLPLGDDDEM